MSASFAQFVFTLLQKTLHKTELKTQKWTKAVFLQLCRMLSYTISVKNHNKNQTRYAHMHNLVFFGFLRELCMFTYVILCVFSLFSITLSAFLLFFVFFAKFSLTFLTYKF